MPAYAITNQNFRDEVVKHSYPFDENSLLKDSLIDIGTDLLIDAVFYLKGDFSLPIRVSKVDGTFGEQTQAKIHISDDSGEEVGTCVIGYDTDDVQVLDSVGVPVGILVFNPEGLDRFIGSVLGKVVNVFSKVAIFLIDLCHVSKAPHTRYIVADGEAVHGDVRVVARNGCRFARTESGGLRLDVIGVDPATQLDGVPVKSINGISNPSIWLENHPRANLRISVDGGNLKFTQARDDTV